MATAAAVMLHKEKDVVAAFQRAGATAPGSARTLQSLELDEGLAVERLKRRAVLRNGEPGTYYLDEPSWEALRGIRRRMALAMLLVVIIVMGALLSMPRS